MADPPNWLVLKQAAEVLTARGHTPFTRQELMAEVWTRYPDRLEGSLNPMIQGITSNLKGGSQGGLGKDILRQVDRGKFILEGKTAEPPAVKQMQLAPHSERSLSRQSNKAGRTVVLVSCVKQKQEQPEAAAQLYVSPLFRKARQFAQTFGDDWFILSALYGLVAPEQLLEPYDLTLKEQGVQERRRWAGRVLEDLLPRLQPHDHLVIIAGRSYREHLIPALQTAGFTVEVPLAGVAGLGEQQNWLAQAVREGKW